MRLLSLLRQDSSIVAMGLGARLFGGVFVHDAITGRFLTAGLLTLVW